MLEKGFIKLYRSLNNWEWKTDPNMFALFGHILINVNYEKKKWRGMVINPGEMVTSVSQLSMNTGLTKMQVRTCLKKLILTNEITSKTTNKYSLITLNNWDFWQSNEDKATSKVTSNLTIKQQTNNKQITTMKERKEIKNIKNISSSSLLPCDIEIPKTFEENEEFLDLLNDYLVIRKEHQKPITKTAIKIILKDLETFENENIGNATLSLKNAITGGFFTLKKPKADIEGGANAKPSSSVAFPSMSEEDSERAKAIIGSVKFNLHNKLSKQNLNSSLVSIDKKEDAFAILIRGTKNTLKFFNDNKEVLTDNTKEKIEFRLIK